MNESPLVSVLMTVYNREKFISSAIDSVITSTYQNWELIIVDDQSKDRSVEIAKQYEAGDDRIKVYVNNQNLGDYPNRNKAASYAKGKYIKYVDADDLIYPYGLEQLVYYMEQFPEAGYGLCSMDPDQKTAYPIELNSHEAYERHYFKSSVFVRAPISAIINRKKFNILGGFSGKRMLGDYEMWHKMSQKYSVVLMPQGIVWYRVHDEQEMSLHRSDPLEPFKYRLCSKEFLLSNACPLTSNQKRIALNRLNKRMSKDILSAIKHHSIKKGIELKKVSGKNYIEILKDLFINEPKLMEI